MIRKFLRIFIVLIGCNVTMAQVPLDTVVIDWSTPNLTKIESDSSAISTTDWLMRATSGQLQLGSPGALATFLVHGLGARHLPVLWHGLNIQSSLNGVLDFNLVPGISGSVFTHDRSNPQGIVGALTIDEKTGMQGSTIWINASSLQNIGLGINSLLKDKKWTNHIIADIGYDKNIFSYKLSDRTYWRSSTDFLKMNLRYIGMVPINSRQNLEMGFWQQYSKRKILPSVSSAPIDQNQLDANTRLFLKWTKIENKYRLEVSSGYMHEILNFTTPTVDSRANVDIFQAKVSLDVCGSFPIQSYLSHRMELAHPNFFSGLKNRQLTQLGGIKTWYLNPRWALMIHARQDLLDNKMMPTMLQLNISYQNSLLILAKNYLYPSLNDLYWPTGGNLDLKPEKSLQASLAQKITLYGWTFKPMIYINILDQMIQWIPINSSVWSPQNISKVAARGMDIEINKDWTLSKNTTLSLNSQFSLNHTSALKHETNHDLVGKQLIFIPRCKGRWTAGYGFKNYSLGLTYLFTSERFESPDHSQVLPATHLFDMQYSWHNQKWYVTAEIKNLFNYQYEGIKYFPMPGINAQLNFTFKL